MLCKLGVTQLQNSKTFNDEKFISFLFSILLIVSCGKEQVEQISSDNGDSLSSEKREIRISDMPTIRGDHYKFNDAAHFLSFYEDLLDLHITDYDAYLDFCNVDIENHNINDIVYTPIIKLHNDEFSNPNDRYKPFLIDPVSMAVCNLDYEFIIGDRLVRIINIGQFLMADLSDAQAISQIRTYPIRTEINPNDLPDNIDMGNVFDDYTIVKRNCKCEVSMFRLDCNTLRIQGDCGGSGSSAVGATVTLIVSVASFGSSGSGLFTFSVNGDFQMDILTTPYNVEDPNNNPLESSGHVAVYFTLDGAADCGATDYEELVFRPLDGICDIGEASTEWGWKEDGGSQAISFRTSYLKGSFISCERAEVFSYWYDSTQDEWINNKQKLEATIKATRRILTCDSVEYEDETKSCDKCESRNTTVSYGNRLYHCGNDVTGTFKKELSWQGNGWSIDHTENIDFLCCD
ncbi:MAG: hypothetical protein ACJATI_000345 [Halioglobus sp.]|jgi:hypothetical protein